MKSIYPSDDVRKQWWAQFKKQQHDEPVMPKEIVAFLARKAAERAAEVMRERCAEWLRDNYQDYANVDSITHAMLALPLETNND